MNKYITTSILAALAAASASAADLVVDSNKTASGSYDNILFTTDGVTLTASNHITANYNLSVSSGVSATMSSAIVNPGYAYYLGNADLTSAASISGAGSSISSLLFDGYILCSKGWSTNNQVLNVSEITLNMQRNSNALIANNLLRGGTVNFTNAVLNVLAPTSGTSQSSIVTNASTSSTANVDLSLTNSTINVASGATLGISASGNAYKKITNSTINVNGTLTGLTNMRFYGTNSITGSSSSTLTLSFINTTAVESLQGMFGDNSAALYITAPKVAITTAAVSNKTSNLYFGVDSLGNETAVAASVSGFQFNGGGVIIKGASTITVSGSANLATNGTSAAQSYIGTGSTVTASAHSRINTAYIDGTLTVTNSTKQDQNGWDYSLAFGTWSTTLSGLRQVGNVTFGQNAAVTNTSSVATNFGLYGNITSYAGVGKINSNANAKLMLYKDTTLTLNSTDAFAVGGAATQGESTFNIFSGATGVKIVANEDNNIGIVNFTDGAAKLSLDIAAGKVLSIGSFTNTVVGGLMDVALGDNLQYGEFMITDMADVLSDYSSQSTLVFTDTSGSSRTLGTDLFITETSTGSGQYYVYTVPEPAEWAAIFGALALGLAIYRKRNSGR